MKALKLIVILLALPFGLLAQESDFEKQFNAFKQQTQQQFDDFKNKNDKVFADFLKQNWESVNTLMSKMPSDKPKPKEIPVAPESSETPVRELPVKKLDRKTDEQIIDEVLKEHTISLLVKPELEQVETKHAAASFSLPMDDFQEQLEEPIKEKLLNYYSYTGQYESFDFYGHQCNLYLKAGALPSLKAKSQKGLTDYWTQVSNDELALAVADQLTVYGNLLELNDWAFLYLVRKASEEIFVEETDRLAFLWFVMIRTGYKVRLGFNEDHLYLLLPTSHALYSTMYFKMGDQKYYVFSFDENQPAPSRLSTYKQDHPDNTRQIQLNFTKAFKQKQVAAYRKLEFQYGGEDYQFDIAYHAGLVEFFNDLPMTEFNVFFSCPLSQTSYQSLIYQIKPLIADKSETEAVNFLLRFVQTAFEYKTDQEQFGYENYLFPEETLHFPYSDCEDRSVLFTRLVTDLLELEVIGLNYPGHVATAVKFKGDVEGDYLKYNDQKYVICDPTFTNAPLGKAMPRYKRIQAEVIDYY